MCCVLAPCVVRPGVRPTGTTLNFFLDGRINKAEILFPGVACFLFGTALIVEAQPPTVHRDHHPP